MREYTFERLNGDKKIIEARSLKKAIIKYDGKPKDHDDHAYITWTSKKKNDSEASVKLPYKSRKERKGKL
tara:strand:+ start:24 stop:233 length:210 start_codon:yes stop_codon:yes gene_type:complete